MVKPTIPAPIMSTLNSSSRGPSGRPVNNIEQYEPIVLQLKLYVALFNYLILESHK
jgi:hypothetical protein